MKLRSAALWFLVLALALPVVQGVLYWVGGLLRSMGDAAGATVVGHVGTGCQVAWSVALVGLLLTLALMSLSERPPEE